MLRYILRRLLIISPLLFGVLVAVFLLMNVLPGDPTDVILGREGGASTQEAREQLRKRLGLDRPLYVRFASDLTRLVRADLGRSLSTNQPVNELIRIVLPDTVNLAVSAMVVAVSLGIPIGVIAAFRANSLFDTGLMVVVFLALSTPSFVLGLILLIVFSYELNWIPVISSGRSLAGLVLPCAALGLPACAAIARVTRSAMLDVLQEGYINTAKAKGLTESAVLRRHALRNAAISITTIVGVYLGYLITGTVIVETVFARRGIGRLVIGAILERDFPVVQAVILMGAIAFMLINLVVDVAYAWLDPRISYE